MSHLQRLSVLPGVRIVWARCLHSTISSWAPTPSSLLSRSDVTITASSPGSPPPLEPEESQVEDTVPYCYTMN